MDEPDKIGLCSLQTGYNNNIFRPSNPAFRPQSIQ
jgi:hypothetical protein